MAIRTELPFFLYLCTNKISKTNKTMRRLILFVAAILTVFSISGATAALTPNKIVIPDIEGYKTLKGDFHVHTVFSDASVWPTTRVQEAVWEGLDILAITEHIDTRHQHMRKKGVFTDKCDRDYSYALAKKAAGKQLLIIHGGEITRGMPPGHFNCLFVQNNEEICTAAEANDHDHVLAMKGGLKEARKQGAFIMWNHPNWHKQAPNVTKMWPEHKKILKEGYMDAIEIYNMACGYSPEAHEWCLKHNLAILGNSDCHQPFFTEIDYLNGDHRPITLVFAKEKSVESVHEALNERRSAVFAEGMVYGREQELDPLFKACVKVKGKKWSDKGVWFTLENKSSIPITLVKAEGSEDLWYPRYIVIPPFSSITVKARPLLVNHKQPKFDASRTSVSVNFYVESFQIGANKPLPFSVSVPRK